MARRRIKFDNDIFDNVSSKIFKISKAGNDFHLNIKLKIKVPMSDAPSTPNPTDPERNTHRDIEYNTSDEAILAGIDFVKILGVSESESSMIISARIHTKIPGTGGL